MVDIARNHRSTDTAVRTDTPPLTGPMPAPAAEPHPAGAGHTAPTARVRPDDRGPMRSSATDPMRPSATEPSPRAATAARYLLAGIRLALGWVFLWAFLDKAFGLGFATPSQRSWVNGGSPTNGFLSSAKGPFSGFYHNIAGTGIADALFMTALLAVGIALLLGIGMRIAAGAGALLTTMMWTAVLPPTTNPFMDDHLIYAAILIVLALLGAGNTLGLGRIWAATPLVHRAPWLK
jgi:thiosulfate dehydrogenase [quinone] large subunit